MCVISRMKFFKEGGGGGGGDVKPGKNAIFIKKNDKTVICRCSTG